MRVIIGVILLLANCGFGYASTTTEAQTTEAPTTSEATSEVPSESPTTPEATTTSSESPTTTTTIPTTTTPLITLNPNLIIGNYSEKYKNLFVSTMNKHREKHLQGRMAYVWSWDDSLQNSAAKRAENCSLTPEKGEDYREVILDEKQWRYTINIPEQLQKPLQAEIYQKGTARVGCAKVIGCDKKEYAFCHFSTSLKSVNPGFDNGSLECVYDNEFKGLCQDLIPSTAPPTTKLYRVANPALMSSRSVFDFVQIIGAFGAFMVVQGAN